MFTIVLLRHGQSQWNVEQRFTGWAEPDLSEKGFAEARAAGHVLAESSFDFDLCFSSLHTRAIKTLDLVLGGLDRLWLPVEKDWRLNERHYGALTGLYHSEVIARYGEEQVHLWRRSFDIAPPPVEPGSQWDFSGDRRYSGIDIPRGESLRETIARVMPYWQKWIAPEVKARRRVLVCGHGNSLRGLVKHLFNIPDEEIASLELPTGKPIICELDERLAGTRRYLI